MFNLGTVFKFEFFRTLKKPSFWIVALSIPILWAGFIGLSYLGAKLSSESTKKLAEQKISFEIADEAGIFTKEFVKSAGGELSNSSTDSLNKVKEGKLDAFYLIPKDLTKNSIQIHAKSSGITDSGKYSAILGSMLKAAATETVNPNKVAILNNVTKTDSKLYKDGKEHNQFGEMIIPGIFLVIFYVTAGFFSNRMLTATTEEKENRVTEMILTSISAKTLIIGKILSLTALACLQIILMVVPVIIAYLIATNALGWKLIDVSFLSNVQFSPEKIIVGLLILIAGLAMLMGSIIGLGAAMPTAQEASNYFSVIIVCLMAPFFVINLFLVGENNAITQFISFFPLTSPIALLLRNTLGTLTLVEAIIGIGLLSVLAVIATWAAIKIFQFGTISYGKRVKVKNLFAK